MNMIQKGFLLTIAAFSLFGNQVYAGSGSAFGFGLGGLALGSMIGAAAHPHNYYDHYYYERPTTRTIYVQQPAIVETTAQTNELAALEQQLADLRAEVATMKDSSKKNVTQQINDAEKELAEMKSTVANAA